LEKNQKHKKNKKSLYSPCQNQLFVEIFMPDKDSRQHGKIEKYQKKLPCRIVGDKWDKKVDNMPLRLVVF
jgi:hypothetical protein